jgi:AbrB family looped-hinge helix DNA binding protein
MNVATLSQRGQVVIPAEVRRAAGWEPGEKLRVSVGDDGGVRLTRVETVDELAARLHKYLKPGIEPLMDPRAFYETREPRL